jgi:hypothetical protein
MPLLPSRRASAQKVVIAKAADIKNPLACRRGCAALFSGTDNEGRLLLRRPAFIDDLFN